MLALSRFPVAVANALAALQKRAQLVTQRPRGEGVAELIDLILSPDFKLQ
jgi:3-deoxy-D-manno-octulosonate 8-phosphate phosphatase KdsC-like HAD superfamily phosphatase